MNILVDQDGVLADFELAFYQAWQASSYANKCPPIELEERNTFYIAQQYPERFRKQIYQIIAKKGFFKNLPPMTNAVEAINAMQEAGHEVFICTSPLTSWQNCVAEKYAWVEKHLGKYWTKKIILTKDKTLVQGDILIDDKPLVTGCMSPTWQHILYDCPYNRAENNLELQTELANKPRLTWKNWQDVLENLDLCD